MSSINLTMVSILLSVMLIACNKPVESVDSSPLVMVIQPMQGQVQHKSYAGEVQARRQTALSFRVSGQISSNLLDVGQSVKAGQVVASLDAKDSQLQLQRHQAEVEQAQASLRLAETELKRYRELLPSHAVSQSQYDSVENQYKNALSQVKQARSAKDSAQNQLRYNQLVAEKNGVITQRLVEVGQVVSAGQTIYQVAVAGERDVVIGVAEKDIAQLKIGQPAWVNLWADKERQLQGRIREIAPALDSSHTYQVKVELAQDKDIQLGQSARVFFQEQQGGQLEVPLTAVSSEQQQAFVWKISPEKKVQKVAVQVVEYGQQSARIIAPLQAEDWIVMAGVHLLHEQQQVKPIDRDNKAVEVTTTSSSH